MIEKVAQDKTAGIGHSSLPITSTLLGNNENSLAQQEGGFTSVIEISGERTQETPTQSRKTFEIPILSFFTGGGFLDIGFEQAGFNIIWRNEYKQMFIRGFEYAMSKFAGIDENPKIHNTHSITDIEPKQIAKEAFHNTPKPDMFGIIGGPPCPDFSAAGRHRGKEGDHGKLSLVYVQRILELQPTFFLFENVPGLLKTEKHRNFLIELAHLLSRDYLIDLKMLNALEFGAPQDRQRVFLIGFQRKWLRKHTNLKHLAKQDIWITQKSLTEGNPSHLLIPQWGSGWFPWPEAQFADAKTKFNWPGKSPFGGNPEKPTGIPDELMVGPLITNLEEIARLPNGLDGFEAKSHKFASVAEGDISGKSFKRLHRWRYSPTAAYGNNEVHLHPTQERRLTVREALRIQTVPDTYAFPEDMPISHKFKMIGNGVPIKLAYAMARSFYEFLGGSLNGTI